MEIGSKIKAARMAANLTQEQVAEALGVSRQTISNWENSKTYPDIVSVVKISDLYHISLDHLLKEEQTMASYMDYLAESTDVVKSNDRKAKTILVCVYLAIWAFSILVFWFAASGSDAMGYGLMYFWILLPAATFTLSLLIGKNHYWGRKNWLCALIFGWMYMLADYATFRAANMVAFATFRMPQFELLAVGTVISAAGIALGYAVRTVRLRRKNSKPSES